jgi:hypothetical protein
MERLRERILNGETIVNVDLSGQGLTSFPGELYQLKDTVEFINFGNNQLSSLPMDLKVFSKLRILFFAQNLFTSIPTVLHDLPALYMLSFKSNQLDSFPEDSLNPNLQWLILTDNRLKHLPKSIGKLTNLRKVMLSGNKLEDLPIEMQQCQNIELIRLAVNNLQEFPAWLTKLPKLSWIAYSANPFVNEWQCSKSSSTSQVFPWASLTQGRLLGEGASGSVYHGYHTNSDGLQREVAIKLYKGSITSDGVAEDEIRVSMLSSLLHGVAV